MSKYICKCGRVISKSTNADNTGNRDTANCTGCPYLLPWGEQEYIKGEGWHLKVKGYECRMSPELQYASRFWGSVTDKNTCSVVSLDYDFLTQISAWIRENYSPSELGGGFSLKTIRPTDFSDKGRYRYVISCAQNKKGVAAKAALKERFFNPNGSRKDMTPEEEERKIKDLIENGKRAAQGAAVEPEQTTAPQNKYPEGYPINNECQCVSCTCTGCHEVCFGHCQGCGNPTSACNSYQTGGEKFLSAAPADAGGATEALATVPDALPAFDYSGLDAPARDSLHVAETMIKEARQKFISDVADAVAIAHEALVQNLHKHNNQYSEASFVSWCASMGISRRAAYNLLNVSTLFKGSTPIERQILEQAKPSLLYAAAKPSAPAEAVAAVKSGDITTLKEYKDLMEQLKAEQAAREAAEKKAVEVEKERDNLIDENDAMCKDLYKVQDQLRTAEHSARDANNAKETAQQSLNQAISERDSARDLLEKAKRRANHLVQERDDALEQLDAANAEMDELRARPIEVAVAEPDPAEIERLAAEKAEGIAAQRTAELQAQVDKLQRAAQEARAQNAEDLKMQDYDTVLFAIDVIKNAWKSAGPAFHRLNDQCRAQLRRNLLEHFDKIAAEVDDT